MSEPPEQFSDSVPLVCPQTHKPLILNGDLLVSTDSETRYCYSIVDGIPVLRPETAEIMELEAWQAITHGH